MDKYKETFETWNKLAELYQDKFMDLELYNESYDLVCNTLTQTNAKILDIGCGPGNISKYLLSKRPDFDIFGIDIAPNMIALAKKNNPAASFALMDSREIDQIETKFDGIICGFCLPYLSQYDCEKLIFDAANLLHNDGLLYISFVEGYPEKSGYQEGSTGDRTYFYFYNLEDLKTQLSNHNFRIDKMLQIKYEKSPSQTDIHTVLIAHKQ
jgi:2-polyprenyl-3-methyl-5-hydroxy-6-metoxy-1,4-benzoquinol methylase